MTSDDDRVTTRERVEVTPDGRIVENDSLCVEAPLEIRIGGIPVAVVMRTPGDDASLVRGFLLTEGIASGAEIESIRHCTQVEPEAEDNVVQVVLRDGVDVDLAALRRNLFASSSCGVCGKASIDQAMRVAPPLGDAAGGDRPSLARVLALPDALARHQRVFERTGGLHAAGLFSATDTPGPGLPIVREDVGRHNAIDKVVGAAETLGIDRQRRRSTILAVSGRVSFEVVQKTLAAGIPTLAAVSAPTSLAVDLARSGGITLAAFVRGERLCLYAGTLADT